MKIISGGVTLPLGFKANGVSCGIKKSGKRDLALIYSEVPALACGMFTANKVQAAPIIISKRHLRNRTAKAIIINSGNANCANGKSGLINAKKVCSFISNSLAVKNDEVLVASTGIIGVPLQIDKIKNAMAQLIGGLDRDTSAKAAQAIMTTDTRLKQIAIKTNIGGRTVSIGAMAKGAGMIYPHLVSSLNKHATMLSFITTDAKITYPALNLALRLAVENSFNCISIDACMSTNDSVFILANGLAGNKIIASNSDDFSLFLEALSLACLELAKMIVMDAEGATKFIKINVKGAKSYSDAKRVAYAIANSVLFKTAVFGEEENWGRILAAVGASEVNFKPERLKFDFSSFKKRQIDININLNMDRSSAVVYTSDLSLDYVRINARYN